MNDLNSIVGSRLGDRAEAEQPILAILSEAHSLFSKIASRLDEMLPPEDAASGGVQEGIATPAPIVALRRYAGGLASLARKIDHRVDRLAAQIG